MSKKKTTDEFVKEAKIVHGDKYDYSKTEYVNSKIKIKYICPKHGEIEQLPTNHLRYGCKLCSKELCTKNAQKNTAKFINEAINIHGEKYDYSKTEYHGTHTKVCIVCPKHGEFWQEPSKHLHGQGCPKCNRSHLEEAVANFLAKQNVKYIEQYSSDFLKNGKGKLKIDFYLPDYNTAIECQGLQHFKECFFGGLETLNKTIKRDIIKKQRCNENDIKILYYTCNEYMKFINHCEIYSEENTFSEIEKLFDSIMN